MESCGPLKDALWQGGSPALFSESGKKLWDDAAPSLTKRELALRR